MKSNSRTDRPAPFPLELPRSWWTIAILLVAVSTATPQAGAAGFKLQRIAENLDQPLYVTTAPGDRNSVYIVEEVTNDYGVGGQGQVSRLDLTTGERVPFLVVDNVVPYFEGGLKGLAFHPDYESNGKFYLSWNELVSGGPRNRVDEYVVADGVPTLTREVLNEPNLSGATHSINWIGFKPTASVEDASYLYIATGDGGRFPTNDQYTAESQDLSSYRGKILRVDVDGEDAYPDDDSRNYAVPDSNPYANDGDDATLGEVFLSGFRNPWRASFDRVTGDMYIGDVGWDQREEIDFVKDGQSGLDFGWSSREGTLETPMDGVGGPKGDSIDPIHEYGHFSQSRSIVGGYVYRGPVEEYQGQYFLAETLLERLYAGSFDRETDPDSFNGDNLDGNREVTPELEATIEGGGVIDNPVSFGEDEFGHLYIVDFGNSSLHLSNLDRGEIFRLVPDVAGDFNYDGLVDAADYTVWRDQLGGAGNLAADADADGSGTVGPEDFAIWKANFGASTTTAAAVPTPTAQALALLAIVCAWMLQSRRSPKDGFNRVAT